jgi:hypothetical protein
VGEAVEVDEVDEVEEVGEREGAGAGAAGDLRRMKIVWIGSRICR